MRRDKKIRENQGIVALEKKDSFFVFFLLSPKQDGGSSEAKKRKA